MAKPNLNLKNNPGNFESEISFDFLEQHQAQEQARLLKRFRELREWQQQQQQQLMLQQQHQLLSLQSEQNKVQSLLAAQRGPESGLQGAMRSGSPLLTPPAKKTIPSTKGNHFHMKSQPTDPGLSHDSGLVMSMQDTLKSQSSLPKPVMYIDPSQIGNQADEDKYTTSELFSNLDPQDDNMILEVEHQPEPSCPDWMSDTSENFQPLRLPPPRLMKSQLLSSNRDQLAGLEELLNTAPPALLHQVLSLLPGHANAPSKTPGAQEVEQSASPTLPVSVPRSQNFTIERSNLPQNMMEGRSLRREDSQESEYDQNAGFDRVVAQSQMEHSQGYDRDNYDQNVHSDEDNDSLDDFHDEYPDSGNEDVSENFSSKAQSSGQERPIQGTHGKKSFEQLLEEQLMADAVASPEPAEPGRPKPFLRKGEGIARFNSAPVKCPKPRPSSQSQKDRNSKSLGRTEKTPVGNRNTSQNVKRIQATGPSKEKDSQSKEATGKHLPPAPRKNAKPMRQEQETSAKAGTSCLSLIHNAAQRRKDSQKFKGEDQMSSIARATPARSEDKGHGRKNSNSDQSPSLDGFSSATDEQDLTELDSLAEFELLEDAADNMSFCSNSSIVKKLVSLDQQSHKEAVKKIKNISDARRQNKEDVPAPQPYRREVPQIAAEPSNNKFSTKENRNNHNTVTANPFQAAMDELRDYTAYFSADASNDGASDSNNNANYLVKMNSAASDDFSSFPNGSADDPKASSSSSPVSPSNVPRAFYLNSDTASSLPVSSSPSSSSKAMTRKIAPISSKFAEANDTLSLLKSLSQKAGLLTSGGDVRPKEKKIEPPNEFTMTGDNSLNSILHLNNAQTLSSDFIEKLRQVSLTDPSITSFQAVNFPPSFIPNTSKITPQPVDDDEKFFSFPMGNDPWRDMAHKDLSAVAEVNEEEDNDSVSDDDCDEDDSDTCESSGEDEKNNTLKANDQQAKAAASSFNPSDFNPFQRLGADSSKSRNAPNKFDDDAEWSEEEKDDEEKRKADERNQDLSSAAMSAANSNNSNNHCHSAVMMNDAGPSSPPTSGLVSKLFPKLKPQPPPQVTQVIESATAANGTVAEGIQSRVLRDKLKELDNEIERFRSENARLNKLRKEREEGLEKLKQEINSFQKEKEEELTRFESFKVQEMKKLKHEKKQFANYQKKMRSMLTRREKEEYDALKAQIEELQEELKRKESRMTSSNARLKNRLSELEVENEELKEERRILEIKRLEWMSSQSQAQSRAAKLTSGKTSMGDAGRTSSEMPYPSHTGAASDSGEKGHERNTRGARASAIPVTTAASGTIAARIQMSANHHRGDSAALSASQANGLTSTNGTIDGAPIQNNSVPVMAENTLINQKKANPDLALTLTSTSTKVPPASIPTDAHGPTSGPVTTDQSSHAKLSPPVDGMEKNVIKIDKGDLRKCKETRHKDGKVEKLFETGAKEIHFPNGTVKEISPDGQTIVCGLANGDIRQIFPDHRVVYIFSEAQIMQTSFPDGLEMFHFKNGQIEKRYPDGTVEITFPSKDIKYFFPDGGQEVILMDGTVMQYTSTGERTVDYPSGDREVHTAEYQRREFPDGIVKTVYANGMHETRFPNGRVRMRDKDGNVIVDQICSS